MNSNHNAKVLVSTITPVFRMKPYLKLFLEELPRQTIFESMEVVFDHNDPDEEEVRWVQNFQKKYPGKVRHIIVRPVESIGASMNRCIKEAQGKFVAVWNVDDLRTPNSLELQVNSLEEANADIAYGNFKIVRRFGEKKVGRTIRADKYPESELTRSMIQGPFYMFRKSLCEKAGYFDEQLRSGADFDLSIRLAHNGKSVCVKECLGYYLDEGKGASTRIDSKQPLDRTVIELRYGIFDKIDLSIIPRTVFFDIPHITFFGERHDVAHFVPGYEMLIKHNSPQIKYSIRSAALESLTHLRGIKTAMRQYVKARLLKMGFKKF